MEKKFWKNWKKKLKKNFFKKIVFKKYLKMDGKKIQKKLLLKKTQMSVNKYNFKIFALQQIVIYLARLMIASIYGVFEWMCGCVNDENQVDDAKLNQHIRFEKN